METFADIINAFESPQALASELGMNGENAAVTVRQWRNRNSIPPDWWEGIISAAAKKGISGVDYPSLIRLRAKSKQEKQKALS